jgi:VWFA-related protein
VVESPVAIGERTPPVKPLAVFAVLLAFLSVAATAQEPPRFGEKVDVNVVLLDAIVTDSSGHQILGLDKGDFVVTENGVEQTIDSIDYFTNRQLLTAQEQNAPFKVERIREQRYFVFFFDKPSEARLWDQVAVARKAARDFVSSQLHPGDLVAVVGHDVRLKVYSDFTSDTKQLLAAFDEAGRFGKGRTSKLGTRGQSLLASMSLTEMMDKTGTVYEGLEVLGNALRPIQGRKNLILFSAGIYEPGQDVRNGVILNESRYYPPMIESLNSADVTVYALNLLRSDVPNAPIFHQTLEQLTSDTNGEYFRFPVSFDPALKKVEQTNNGYYLISYTARHPQRTHGYQKVTVSVKNHPEFRVKAREGYTYGETSF